MPFMICLVLLRLLYLPSDNANAEPNVTDAQARLESEILSPKDRHDGQDDTADEGTFDGVDEGDASRGGGGKDGSEEAEPTAASPPPPDALATSVAIVFEQGTKLPLTIALRSDLSPSSADFWREAAALSCSGQIYRSESFLMQGRIACPALKTKVVKGRCPEGVAPDPSRRCPSHDPQCGCHGPIMTRGMVGWAGGGSGPDFFIYTDTAPATHWAHDHTVIGLVDEQGMRALEQLHALPTKADQGRLAWWHDDACCAGGAARDAQVNYLHRIIIFLTEQ